MAALTLVKRGHDLADAQSQRDKLQQSRHRRFELSLMESELFPLTARGVTTLQVNVGKMCNQTCTHCHVDAGPDRTEIMTRDTMQHCLDAIERGNINTLDITGGAPELNPDFEWFVGSARRLGTHVIDRCNLTILTVPRFKAMPEFLAQNQVEVVASLPCYSEANTDKQRGDGVFEKSIRALKRLNELGYGHADSGLSLTLVYNPGGPSLPPPQAKLENDYRKQLQEQFGIVFTRLITITNLPISRFLEDLVATDRYDAYMQKLIDSYNPIAAEGVMCRDVISVSWDGQLYDCDFNQMLELNLGRGMPTHISEFDPTLLAERTIVTGQHCYGCTAGQGSSCQGSITN